MSRLDSDSKRRRYNFRRDPSPKRFRRDEKQERERERESARERDRVTTGANLANRDHVDRDQRNHHWLHDALQLETPSAHHSKQETVAMNKDMDKKPNDRYEAPKHSSDSTHAPRSRSYFQLDDQGSAGQVGRSTGQREAGEHGWWKDSKDQHNGRVETSHGRKQRDEKSLAKPDDNFQRRDAFSEKKDDPTPTIRKRPAFREKKVPMDSGDANPAATAAMRLSQTDHPPEKNERREKRSSNPCHLDRPDRQFTEERATNKSEARRDGFSLRVRYAGSGSNSNYRGRDKFNGRQGYHPGKTRTQKWKHDLYQEVNKDPNPKNEDDQIAKLEALLAS